MHFKKNISLIIIQGWWLIDVQGELGWAPASYLILNDEDDVEEEEQENEALITQDKGSVQL